MDDGPRAPRPIDFAYDHHVSGRLDEAERCYRAIIASTPLDMDARGNLLDLLRSQHRWTEADALIRDALSVRLDDPDWTFRLANSLLAEGRYGEGWPLYEARRHVSRARVEAPPLPFPEWDGGPVGSLLVWPEQGFGDAIQFSRYLPLLRARGIVVNLVCRPPLLRLLAPLADTASPLESGVRIPASDAWVLIGSLPHRLGSPIPPTALPQARGNGTGLGVVVRGRPSHFNDANRSLPGEIAAELLSLPGAMSLDPADTGAKDFADTAAIISDLSAVLSVDTAQAHLAASLGKPTAILLPYLNPDWRWMRDREDSPWYPSVRLYRQPAPGEWRTPIRQALADLPYSPKPYSGVTR